MQDDVDLHELASAMLDGAPVDWESAESAPADESMRSAVHALRIIAEIADVHTSAPLSSDFRATRSDTVQIDSTPPSDVADAERLPEPLPSWSGLRLLEKVGEGAYGDVYRAWDARLDREVALKLLRRHDFEHSRAASTVIDEGRMLAQVRHPNVVTVHGADRSAGRVGLWMEFIRGRTLEQILSDQGPVGVQEATQIGLDLCRALSAVHRAGLLHRDIKAQNVMQEDGGRIVLMDFGTGLDHPEDSGDSAPGLAGTPIYMAPEVLDGQEASVQADIYGVGVLLYHLVTASYPIHGRSVQDVRDAHARGERTSLRDVRPDLPGAFVQIVERALAPRPEVRYESAGAMEAALASAGEPLISTGDTVMTLARPARTTWPWRTAAIVATLLVVATMGSLWLTGGTSVPPAIAVLPLENLSSDPAQEYFALGMTDELIGSLAQIRTLRVVSGRSAMSLKGSTKSLAEIARDLKVDWVIRGSVQLADGRTRIRVQLLHASSDTYRFSRDYDSELSDVLKLQTEVARSVAEEIRVQIGPEDRARMASVATVNPAAHEEYLLGRYLFWKFNEEDRVKAIDHFNRAIQLDARYAAPYAGLAETWWIRGVFGPLSLKEAAPPARAAARKALELDDRLAEAYAARAYVEGMFDWDWTGAERTIRRALELEPNNLDAHYVYATLLMALGRLPEAITQIEHAAQLDPLSAQVQSTFGRILYRARKFDEAIVRLNRAIELEPRNTPVYARLGDVYEQMVKHPEALVLYEKHRELPGSTARIARVYARMGRVSEAHEMVKGLGAGAGGPAAVYAELGDKDAAFRVLFKVVEERTDFSIYVKTDPWFDSLHSDPRWTQLLRRMNLSD